MWKRQHREGGARNRHGPATHTIFSARHVQHGDPLGFFLCVFAIHLVLLESKIRTDLAHQGGVDVQNFYLDDGFIAGPTLMIKCFSQVLRDGARAGTHSRISSRVKVQRRKVAEA